MGPTTQHVFLVLSAEHPLLYSLQYKGLKTTVSYLFPDSKSIVIIILSDEK